MESDLERRGPRIPWRAGVIGLSVLAGLACGDNATGPEGDGELGEWLRSNGVVRTYELRIPDSYVQGQPTPVLLAFHGNPGTGEGFESYTGLTPYAMDAGFITVYPDGIQGTWGIEAVLLVHDLILHLADSLSVDKDRVYVTGFSAGGSITQLIACALPDEVAAAAVVGATIEKEISDACLSSRLIPIMLVHGTDDPVFPWDGAIFGNVIRFSMEATLNRWKVLNQCQGDPVVDTLPDLVDDGTRVWSESWTDCGGSAEILFYGVENGRHTWPSGTSSFPPGYMTREISGQEIVDFLGRHTLGG